MDRTVVLTQGSIPRQLIWLALPLICGNILQQLYNTVDAFIIGRFLGGAAFGAVGVAGTVMNLFIFILSGCCTGIAVLFAQFYGSRDLASFRREGFLSLVFGLLLTAVLGLGGLVLLGPLLRLIQTPGELRPLVTEYLNVIFLGLPVTFLYNLGSAALRAAGNTLAALLPLAAATMLNVGLDLYLVLTLRMGVAGVAWATLIAQGVSAVAAFLLFARELRAYDAPSAVCFDVRELKNMARVALPSVFQQSTVSIGMMLVQSVVNSFGAETLAGYSAAMRIESICTVPMAAVGNAMSSYTAQNIGAGEYSRVRRGYRACYGILAAFALVIFAALQCFSQQLIALFLNAESSRLALETGTSCIRFLGWFYILIGLKMATDGVLRGAGDMGAFTAANLVNLTLRVVLAAVLAPRLGIRMVWYAVPVGWAANYLISFLRYRTGRWRERGAGLLA